MKKSKNIIVSLILCMVLILSACGQADTKDNVAAKAPDKVAEKEYQPQLDALRPQAYNQVSGLNLEAGTYISIIGRTADAVYWNAAKKGAQQAADDINSMLGYKGDDKVKVNYSGPVERDNVDSQINILDEELARYPAAVGIAIIDAQACSVQFDLAAENGIPIVAFDSGSDYQGIVSMVGTNNEEAAKTAAVKMGNEVKDEGEIFLIVHDSKSTSGEEREAAIIEELTANHAQISVVETIHLDELEDLAKTIAAEKNAGLAEGEAPLDPAALKEADILAHYFTKYPNVKGALCTNITTTQAIIAAKDKAEKESDDFKIVGFDGGEKQLDALKSGDVSGLIVQNPFGMGYATVVAAARAILEQGNEAVIDSGYIWVTKDNMEKKSIKDMFY